MKRLKKLVVLACFVLLCAAQFIKAGPWDTTVYIVNKTEYPFQTTLVSEKWGEVGGPHWQKKNKVRIKIPNDGHRVKVFSISRERVEYSGDYRITTSTIESKDIPYKLKITANYTYKKGYIITYTPRKTFKIKLKKLSKKNKEGIKYSYEYVDAGKKVKDVVIFLKQEKK